MQAQRPFVFGIPLISKAASRDWAAVQRLLSQTLRSILRQTDPDFRVLVAGQDRPDIAEMADARVEFLRSDFPIPETHQQKTWDKGSKRNLIAQRLRELGGGYLMMFDADDLASKRLVEWVRAQPGGDGYLLQRGYCLDAKARRLFRVPPLFARDFDQVCGSCSVLHLTPEDLPLPGTNTSYFDHLRNHVRQATLAREAGRPLRPLGLAAVIYLTNHAQNLSDEAGGARRSPLRAAREWLRRLQARVGAAETARLREEFLVPEAYL